MVGDDRANLAQHAVAEYSANHFAVRHIPRPHRLHHERTLPSCCVGDRLLSGYWRTGPRGATLRESAPRAPGGRPARRQLRPRTVAPSTWSTPRGRTDQLRATREVTEIAAVTAHFNFAARDQAALLDTAIETGAVLARGDRSHSPNPAHAPTPAVRKQSGAPTDIGVPETIGRALEPIASRHGASIPQIALAWLLARSPAVMPVPPPQSSCTCCRSEIAWCGGRPSYPSQRAYRCDR